MKPVSQDHSTKAWQTTSKAPHLCPPEFTGRPYALPLNRFKQSLILAMSFVVALLLSASVYAQNSRSIRGTVTDEKDVAMPGVSVTIKGTTTGTMTDASGRFTINAATGQTLVISMVGYTPFQVVVSNQTMVNAKLSPTASSLNEVVVVGYGQQTKASVTSAISSVSNADIVTTKNENIMNSLAGKVPGLRVVQNTGEPGAFANNFDIRGFGSPLIVIDGIPRPDIARVDPNDVESISVLKDASAAVYGVRAANGVILITTKKGKMGAPELTYTGFYGLQSPINFGKATNAQDYMVLFNEQQVHNRGGNGIRGNRQFTDAQIAEYVNGTKQSTDWVDAVMRPNVPEQQHNLSASGGTDKTSYYISGGYTGQDGILRSGDLTYNKYNFRSNLSTKIANNLKFDLNLSGTMERTVRPNPTNGTYWVIRSAWYTLPTAPLYANNTPPYYYAVPNPPLQAVAQSEIDASGYYNVNNKWFQSAANLTYDVPFVKGLSLKGLYSFDFVLNDNKYYYKAYNEYDYDTTTGAYVVKNTQGSPSTLRREMYEYPTSLGQFWLSYSRSFNNTHNVSGSLIYEESTRSGDNFFAQRELTLQVDQLFAGNSTNQQGNMSQSQSNAFTYKTAAYIGNFTYDFKSRYFAKFAFRYDGSSRFAAERQWGFFPDAEAGWRLSEEPFFKAIKPLSFITNLKFRGSYGILGDDSASSYQFLTGYNYPFSGNAMLQPGGSVFGSTFVSALQSKGIANPGITWYKAKTFDIGADFEAWSGKLGITFDYFRRDRSGLLANQLNSLADVVGASLPQQNLNSDRTEGFDFDISTRNHIGAFGYNLKGTMGFARIMNLTYVSAQLGNSYLNWSQRDGNNFGTGANRYTNIYFGLNRNGQFENYQAIENSPFFVPRNTTVGDYRYTDWNGDGQINADDYHPFATVGLPVMTFGLNVGLSYKNFDLNALFQGAAMVTSSAFEQAQQPLWAGGNALTKFLDRWHPTDPNADPYSPSTQWTQGYYSYTGTYAVTNSEWNTFNASYVRLKNIEVGYSLPKKLLGHIGVKGIRVFFNGYNLLTFTGLKYTDPEHPEFTSQFTRSSNQYDYAYPLTKTYIFGLTAKF
ncbi:TonB-dependent receptor [Mucilaginibacter mali]|uniref:TonB-dependent receptor n=1 Tax=Mucilaginibacter mali TaxID=2740462 RepID=A0A7D4QBK8_9SPHI|nr:TonB-dependent receptor [Mucilaginibacter mali]QKJ30584.1 TonB-dependent receptor [Mucilaginibacter mali]